MPDGRTACGNVSDIGLLPIPCVLYPLGSSLMLPSSVAPSPFTASTMTIKVSPQSRLPSCDRVALQIPSLVRELFPDPTLGLMP